MLPWKRLALLGAGAALFWLGPPAHASSHREAPLISEDPQADNTDVYFFRSPTDPGKAVILANYLPGEEPSAGPNYYTFSDRVLYDVNVDRNGDGKDDLIFRFRFKTHIQTAGTFLNFLGPVTKLTSDGSSVATAGNINPLYNRYQTYDVSLIRRVGRIERSSVIAQNVIVPPNNVGSTTTPNFPALVDQAVHTVPNLGIRTFAGQIDDPFFIDLGGFFDLLRVRPYRSLHALNGMLPLPDRADAPDTLSGFNCHTLALEVPITLLTGTAAVPSATDPRRIVGVYASASRPRVTVLRNGKVTVQRPYVQVSRQGAPLVNELFIPIKDEKNRTKDSWNASDPEDDARFRSFFQFPEPSLRLAQLYPVLRPVIPNIKPDASGFTGPRTDLTGGAVPLLNFAPDLLRLDVSVPVNPNPNRLGALAGDAQGFPNGRRLGDDVVDIYMRAAAGALVPGNVTVGDFTGSRAQFLEAIHFGDGVDAHENGRFPFRTTFPFAPNAHGGVNPAHLGYDDPEKETP